MNKQQWEKLKDLLAKPIEINSEQLHGGCICKTEPLFHPIMIGDILERISKMSFDMPMCISICDRFKGDNFKNIILKLWQHCGFDRSLNQIIEESGWDFAQCIDPDCKCGTFPLRNDKCEYKPYLKNPNARELCEFLCKIFKI